MKQIKKNISLVLLIALSAAILCCDGVVYDELFDHTCTLTYDDNSSTGGVIPSDPVTYREGQVITVLDNTETLVRTGYTFGGWNTEPDGSGTTYLPGTSLLTTNYSVILYALWIGNNYTITFDPDGGAGTMTPQVIPCGTTLPLSTNTFTRAGYSFAGWSTTSGGAVVYADNVPYTMGPSDITLYAQWYPGPALTAASYTLWKCDSATITNLQGTGFRTGATVILQRSGFSDIAASVVNVVSGTQITCQFDLSAITDAEAGQWNIVVENDDGLNDTLGNALTMNRRLTEDWESGTDGWIDSAAPGDTYNLVATPVHGGSSCMSIIAVNDWNFFDGFHFIFEGGFQPEYIGFWIRKETEANDPSINFGDDNTNLTNGGIWYKWDDVYGNRTGTPNVMFVQDGSSINHLSGQYLGDIYNHVELMNINFVTQTYDFYINGSVIATNVTFHTATTSFTRLYISLAWYGDPSYTYIDDIDMH